MDSKELKIPIMTAEEFFRSILVQASINEYGNYDLYDIEKAMIEFTRYHVQRAIEKIVEEVYIERNICDIYEVNLDSILKAYPLENIK